MDSGAPPSASAIALALHCCNALFGRVCAPPHSLAKKTPPCPYRPAGCCGTAAARPTRRASSSARWCAACSMRSLLSLPASPLAGEVACASVGSSLHWHSLTPPPPRTPAHLHHTPIRTASTQENGVKEEYALAEAGRAQAAEAGCARHPLAAAAFCFAPQRPSAPPSFVPPHLALLPPLLHPHGTHVTPFSAFVALFLVIPPAPEHQAPPRGRAARRRPERRRPRRLRVALLPCA